MHKHAAALILVTALGGLAHADGVNGISQAIDPTAPKPRPDGDIARALADAKAGDHDAALDGFRRAVHRTTIGGKMKSAKARYFLGKAYREATLRATSWQEARQQRAMAIQHLRGAVELLQDKTYGDNAEYGRHAQAYLDQMRRGGPFSARAQSQMQSLVVDARGFSAGKAPDGNCFAWVAGVRGQAFSHYSHLAGGRLQTRDGFLTKTPYGKLGGRRSDGRDNWTSIPWGGAQSEARHFAEHLNAIGPRAMRERYGLRRLLISNPYDAPAGAIVVVAAGSPGTSHPTAGDVAVAGGDGRFFNGGEMNYGGRGAFQWQGANANRFLLGVYVPVD